MTDAPDSYTQAEIVRTLKRIDQNVSTLSDDIKRLEQNYVTRGEFTLYKENNDRELKQIKDAAAPVKTSGWAIASFAVAAIVGLGSLLGLAITLMTVIR